MWLLSCTCALLQDIFQAFIYTRGGPLWQKVQIPFSDFLLTHAGYVQNEQSHMDIARIEHVGILYVNAGARFNVWLPAAHPHPPWHCGWPCNHPGMAIAYA